MPKEAPLPIKVGARQAYRQILRYIHARKLGTGDQLPSQAMLRKRLGLGNSALAAAMRLMVVDGVLTRRQKIGTQVTDLSRAKQTIWMVGITQYYHEGVGFAGILEHYLRRFLLQSGCEDRTFFRPVAPRNRPHRLDDFHGLAEAVEAGQVDAIISSEHLVAPDNVMVFHLSAADDSRFGIRLDHETFTRQAIGELVLRGCSRIAWVGPENPDYLGQQLETRIEKVLGALNHSGLTFGIEHLRGSAADAGAGLAKRLLSLPARERPDGLILQDDYVTMGLADVLRDQAAYRPQIVTVVSRQAPLRFTLPVVRFEIDIEKFARLAVDMLLERLLDPQTPPHVESYAIPMKRKPADKAG